MQHGIGANEAKPAFDILSVLGQPRGEVVDHAVDDAGLLVARHRLDFGGERRIGRRTSLRRDTGFGGLGGGAGEGCELLTHRHGPWRTRGRVLEQRLPDVPRPRRVAILGRREAKIEAGERQRRVLRGRRLKFVSGLRRHLAARRIDQSFAIDGPAVAAFRH